MKEAKFKVLNQTKNEVLYLSGVFNNKPYTQRSIFPQYESIPEPHQLSEPLLYIGRKDISGRDTYEGDTISFRRYVNKVKYWTVTGKVEYDDHDCCFYCVDREGMTRWPFSRIDDYEIMEGK